MIELEGKRVLVVGLGESGYAAATVANGLGAAVTAIDSAAEPELAGRVESLRQRGIDARLGVSVPDDLAGFELLVASPGVPGHAPVLVQAHASGVRVMSELELGYRLLQDHTFVAITGTNGKTTTTKLLGSLLDRPDRPAVTCGNIGNPVVGLFEQVADDALLVVEVSSFQLQHIERFKPHVAVILNIAPDHFDWHDGFEEYVAAKRRITENQQAEDFVVFNRDDELCAAIARDAKATALGFGFGPGEGTAVWCEDGWVKAGAPLPVADILPAHEVRLAGRHNLENVMAAAAAALACGETPQSIRAKVAEFEVIEHRTEPVRTLGGVTWYNDSKATNPHATLSALRSFDGPLVLIMGGRNKGIDFTELAQELCARLDTGALTGVVLMGECAEEMASAIASVRPAEYGPRVVLAPGLSEAVQLAAVLAGGSGVVLFSPATASFDLFDDYKHRGRAFKQCVMDLEEGP